MTANDPLRPFNVTTNRTFALVYFGFVSVQVSDRRLWNDIDS